MFEPLKTLFCTTLKIRMRGQPPQHGREKSRMFDYANFLPNANNTHVL